MKNKKERSKQSVITQNAGAISILGRKMILVGVAILVCGFILLTRTDPAGQNWASILSPFLILGGYLIIGIGIITPDKTVEQKNAV